MTGSSTIACIHPRLLLREPPRPSQKRYSGSSGRILARQPSCSSAGLQRRPWLQRLRRALADDRFVLHFQPIVSLADGQIAHHEALVRLDDGVTEGLIAPQAFLPAAERYGLIRELDRLVLEKVARLLGSVPAGELPGQGITMNLSALSVTDQDMLGEIEAALARHNADPELLVIELTETASISNMQRAKAFCAGASELGCAIALDDFGTGFGSLHYLKHLPFRYLKIDGDFIRGLPDSHNDQLVVEALVRLARGLGAYTIAEFVTDDATIALLCELGVDYAQGYAIGMPRPALEPAA